ncbi:SH3 domain-containing protein [Azospirillum sp. TSO22-1]|uniref:SH3 domain-containing protein n=1 Tax=Azospirillum sp. TSO22-1 TaxID=716789 RepID=UPI000D6533F9|nr:SH3 domain-containing protein [Azospirillum sp. TSO22-1]
MRRQALLLTLALLALPAATVRAQTAQAPADRLTPRPPPAAVLPKATPVHAEPKGRAPAGVAVLQPLPAVAPPLSPVVVPGEAPAIAAAAPTTTPAAPAAPPPAPAAKPKAVAEAPKPEPAKPADRKPATRTVYAKEGIYIRATPSRKGTVLDTLEEGEAAQVLPDKAPEEGWVRIARNGRPVGWVSSSFLTERRPK